MIRGSIADSSCRGYYRVRKVTASTLFQLLCVPFMTCICACVPSTPSPSTAKARETVLTYDWNDRTTGGAHSNIVSLSGNLLSGVSGDPPSPRIQGCTRQINGNRYDGVIIFDSQDRDSVKIEVLICGEKDRVLVHTRSKIGITIEVTNHSKESIIWIESSTKKTEPIDLSPGDHQIEIIGTPVRIKKVSEK
jgi:hypothetical protein